MPSSSAIGPATLDRWNVSCHARTWSWILRAGCAQSTVAIVLAEMPGPGGFLVVLRVAGIPGRETLEHLRQEREQGHGQLRTDLLDRAVVVLDRHRRLREDRAGVQLGVHAVPGDAELSVAVAERPGHRNRPAVTRQLAWMLIDSSEARPRRAPPAAASTGTRSRARGRARARAAGRNRPLVLREEEADPVGSHAVGDLAPGRQRTVIVTVAPRQQPADRLVSQLAQERHELLHDRVHPRDDRDAPRAHGASSGGAR